MSLASRLAAVTLSLASLIFARSAHAWTYGGMISASSPCPSASSALVIAHEAVDLDCTDSDAAHMRCALRATYTVRNPTSETLHAAVSIGENDGTLSVANGPESREVELVVAPGAEVELVMRGSRSAELRRESRSFHGFDQGALGLMHPLLVEPSDSGVRVLLTWQRANHCAAPSTWGAVGEITLVTHVPSSWNTTVGWEQMSLCRRTGRSLDCLQADETEATGVSMSVERSHPGVFRAGGPVLGLGATTPHGVRARLGYEFGIGRRFVGAASIEGDVAGNLVFTPTVGYGFRLWRVSWWRDAGFPGALVAWLGAPVGVLPDRRVGVRGQASLLWVFGGLDVAVDYWPVDGRTDVSVMLRVGI